MDEAEREAVTIISEWLNRNPVCSPPGRCLGCGRGELVDNPLLPFGVEPTGHAWLWHFPDLLALDRKAELA
jgi:hypothetical protein